MLCGFQLVHMLDPCRYHGITIISNEYYAMRRWDEDPGIEKVIAKGI
jgi:hypothetical protein